ncbi:hypothetical protein POM88_054310 [Heracleum sosnowskyi]|uniref:Uncharacterized protein n=1 Tax=Heracleum sosnowskyi TaxID=360622 RepID=A0AAD8GN02_9APIA|nr:hypothetical protein POM88_054310 [Heracleum sosnowskyi]
MVQRWSTEDRGGAQSTGGRRWRWTEDDGGGGELTEEDEGGQRWRCSATLALSFLFFGVVVFFISIKWIGDKCSHKGITSFTKQLSEWSKSDGYCLPQLLTLQTWKALKEPLSA